MYSMILADDEVLIVRGLKKLVDWAAYDIQITGEAVNGREALDLLLEQKPDLAILDICMPEQNGLEILRTIKKMGLNTRVIFLSGYEEFEYAQKALQFGAEAYLLKPVETGELLAAVQNIQAGIAREKDTSQALERLSQMEKSDFLDLDKVESQYPFHTALAMAVKDIDMADDAEMVRLILFSIYGIVDSFVSARKLGISFSKGNTIYVILNHEEGNFPVVMAESIYEEVLRKRNKALYIGVGTAVEGMENIKASIQAANDALNYRFIKGDSPVLTYFRDAAEDVERNIGTDQGVLDKIMKYVAEHYAESLTLDAVARIVHLNPVYLSAYFKKQTGLNFKDYLTKVRMAEALSLLRKADLKTYQLAERVGFSDARHFSEVFKRYYGKTPAEYKRNPVSTKENAKS